MVATNVANNQRTEARSDTTGRYVVPQLQPGVYTLEASAAGFKRFVQTSVKLAVGQQARLDISLTVGEVTENVTVEAATTTIETSTSTIGKVVSNRAILNLPLNSRNIYSLIYLTPGVAGSIGNNYNSMSYSVNGARASMMDTLIDGATASHPTVQGYSGISAFPSVDAIGEFKVLGANFPAEYGRTAGSVLNVVYKSGTNEFHGTAYEFLRNSTLDANTFYNNLRGIPLASFKRSQYGGTFGGPVGEGPDFLHEFVRRLAAAQFQFDRTSHRAHRAAAVRQFFGDLCRRKQSGADLRPVHDARLRHQLYPRPVPGQHHSRPAAGQSRRTNHMKYFPAAKRTGAAFTNANNYYSQGSSVLDIDQFDGTRRSQLHRHSPPVRALFATATRTACRRCCGPRN